MKAISRFSFFELLDSRFSVKKSWVKALKWKKQIFTYQNQNYNDIFLFLISSVKRREEMSMVYKFVMQKGFSLELVNNKIFKLLAWNYNFDFNLGGNLWLLKNVNQSSSVSLILIVKLFEEFLKKKKYSALFFFMEGYLIPASFLMVFSFFSKITFCLSLLSLIKIININWIHEYKKSIIKESV